MPIWLLDGTLVSFDGLLLDPETGSAVELPRGAVVAPGRDRTVAILEARPSWRVRVLRDGEERWSVDLPEPIPDDARAVLALRDDTVIVHATSANTGEVTCWSVGPGGAERPAACLEASFVAVDALLPAGGDTWVVASHGEGHPAVDLVRWSGGGSEALPVPWSDLYPHGELALRPRTDGSFDVLTTCELGPERPCLASVTDDRTDEGVRRYRWTPGSDPALIEVDRGDSPRVPDPTSERVVWIKGDRWCVDGPGRPRRCFPLP